MLHVGEAQTLGRMHASRDEISPYIARKQVEIMLDQGGFVKVVSVGSRATPLFLRGEARRLLQKALFYYYFIIILL